MAYFRRHLGSSFSLNSPPPPFGMALPWGRVPNAVVAAAWYPGCPMWGPFLYEHFGLPPAPDTVQGAGRVIRDWATQMLERGWPEDAVKQALLNSGWSMSRRQLIVRQARATVIGH